MKRGLLLAFVLLPVLLTAPLRAQQVPPPEEGDPLVSVEMENGMLSMRDVRNNRVLIEPRRYRIFNDLGQQSVTPQITLNEQPTGFDLVVDYHNTHANARPLGAIGIGVITAGHDITYWDFRQQGRQRQTDTTSHINQGFQYPHRLYAPAMVIMNEDYAIGATVQYPIMEYKHDVRVSIRAPRGRFLVGEGGPGWDIEFRFSNSPAGSNILYPALLEPGQKRRYVISLRVAPDPEDWLRTLVPYRNFFHDLYGGVTYQRDPRPAVGLVTATSAHFSNSNPRGLGPPSRRPDVHGWGRWTAYIRNDLRHWERMMIWAPTGLYRHHTENNFPPQMATEWLTDPNLATALDPEVGFPSVARNGQQVGLWWGRATRIASGWDVPVLEHLDMENPEHVAKLMAEVDVAVDAGVTFIGLDAFSHRNIPVWDAVVWLERLRNRAPGVDYLIEPTAPDVLHRIVPSYVTGWILHRTPTVPEDMYEVSSPFYLADFLLPGHETWGAIRYDGYRTHFGRSATLEERSDWAARYAEWGYVPNPFGDFRPDARHMAAESWLTSIPPDLRIGSPPNSGG